MFKCILLTCVTFLSFPSHAMEGQRGDHITPLWNFSPPHKMALEYSQHTASHLEATQGPFHFKNLHPELRQAEKREKKRVLKKEKMKNLEKEIREQERQHQLSMAQKLEKLQKLKNKLVAPVDCPQIIEPPIPPFSSSLPTRSTLPSWLTPLRPHAYFGHEIPSLPSVTLPLFSREEEGKIEYTLPDSETLEEIIESGMIHPNSPHDLTGEFALEDTEDSATVCLEDDEIVLSEDEQDQVLEIPLENQENILTEDEDEWTSTPEVTSEDQESILTEDEWTSTPEVTLEDQEIVSSEDEWEMAEDISSDTPAKTKMMKRKFNSLTTQNETVIIPKINNPGRRPTLKAPAAPDGLITDKTCTPLDNNQMYSLFKTIASRKNIKVMLQKESKAKGNKIEAKKLKKENRKHWVELALEIKGKLLPDDHDVNAYHRLHCLIRKIAHHDALIKATKSACGNMAPLFLNNISKALHAVKNEHRAKIEELLPLEKYIFNWMIDKIYTLCPRGASVDIKILAEEIIEDIDKEKNERARVEKLKSSSKKMRYYTHSALKGQLQRLKHKNVQFAPAEIKKIYDEIIRKMYNLCAQSYRLKEKAKKARFLNHHK